MNTNLQYAATFISNRQIVTVLERSLTEENRELEVHVNRRFVGNISIPLTYLPGIALSDSALAIWGGTRLYVGSLPGTQIERFEQEDEIHAAFQFEDHWLLICETSVVLWDHVEGLIARYEHNEVLIWIAWSDDILVVEDFQGRTLTFHPSSFRSGLIPDIKEPKD